MQVVLIGKDKLSKLSLPTNIKGSYWLVDSVTKEKILNIYAYNEKWQIESNEHIKIINPKYVNITEEGVVADEVDGAVQYAILKECNMFAIVFDNSDEVFVLYCLPNTDKHFTHFDITKLPTLSIGADNQNDIISTSPFVSRIHTKVFRRNNVWYVQNYNNEYGTFINNKPIYNEIKKLEHGDIIFIMGLRIVIIDNNLFMSNPRNTIIFE